MRKKEQNGHLQCGAKGEGAMWRGTGEMQRGVDDGVPAVKQGQDRCEKGEIHRGLMEVIWEGWKWLGENADEIGDIGLKFV